MKNQENRLNSRDLVNERNTLDKIHIPSDKSTEKSFGFRG